MNLVILTTFVPPCPAGTAHDATRFCSGVFPVFNHLVTVDKNVMDASGIVVRILESRMVLNSRGVKDHHIGEKALDESPPVANADIVGR